MTYQGDALDVLLFPFDHSCLEKWYMICKSEESVYTKVLNVNIS